MVFQEVDVANINFMRQWEYIVYLSGIGYFIFMLAYM